LAARRSQTERDLERAERLVAAKAATGEELERARAARDTLRAAEDASRARLKEGERRLSEGTLRAPFPGTITEVFYQPGEVTTPGMPVAMLSGTGEVEVTVEVPELVIGRIQKGDPVRLELPVLGTESIVGEVKSVGRTAAGPGHLFPVVVTIPPSPRLIAGATAELVLHLETTNALALPVEAVINPGGHQPAVFKVVQDQDGAHVTKVQVDVGTLLGNQVTVDGDLKPGDLVVVGGQRGLLVGEAVEIDR
jgi:RND family efflux transporter MFP subunit